MVFSDTSAHCHPQTRSLRHDLEDLAGRQVESELQVVDFDARALRRRGFGRAEPECRIESHRLRLTLERYVVEEALWRERNHRLESLNSPFIAAPTGVVRP